MAIVFPSTPAVGQVFTSGGRSWVWNGTTWDSPSSATAALSGLTLIRTVDFSAIASVSVDNVFSNNYDSYKIILLPSSSVGTTPTISFIYRNAGSNITTATYNTHRIVAFSNGTASSLNVTGNTVHALSVIDAATATTYFAEIDVHDPFNARVKKYNASIFTQFNGTAYNENHKGINTTATPFDGFTITTSGTSISGSVKIYGYRK